MIVAAGIIILGVVLVGAFWAKREAEIMQSASFGEDEDD